MYYLDYDFVTIKSQRNNDAEVHFRNAIKLYVDGIWSEAQYKLEQYTMALGYEDGASKVITEFMQRSKMEVPKDWANCRNIDYKYPRINTDFMDEQIEGEEGQEDQDNEDEENSEN
jgi:hypothetical protein